ncbi:integrase, catalytic region, zinc finger, CCHC-type containing protein [Tanacetum coccineum]
MKEILKELEAEVDQNVVNRMYDEIEQKNLLIANDNLIVDCLSKEVFYITTNSELTVSIFTEMHDAHTIVQAHCLELEAELSKLNNKIQKDDHNELVKHFFNLEIMRAKHIEQTTALLTENKNINVQINEKMKCVTMDSVKPKVLAPSMYAIDVEPISPHRRNNREVHLDYLKHLKERVETLREIVEEAKVEIPLDRSLASACVYTKKSQELKKQVTFEDQCETSNNNTQKHVKQLNIQKTNVYVIPSTGVNSCTDASGSMPRSNSKKNRISSDKSVNKKKVEEHPRTNKSSRKKSNHVDYSISSKRAINNSNSRSVCKTCHKCFISANHDMCVVNYLNFVNASPSVKNVVSKVKKVWKPKQVKQVWKATGKLVTNVGYQWKPTGRKFTLGEQCPLNRFTKSKVVPVQQTENIILWYLDSGCTKHMTRNRSRLRNFMKKFIGTVRFGNDHFGAIMGYGDYVIGDSVISRVYHVEGLGHNLFSVGQFFDFDLEVAFRKHSCYVRDTDDVELIKGSRISNLYIISVEDMMKSSPICLLSKASKNKSWLWHRHLNHSNFGTINDLARKDLVRGLPRLKFEKDHLCSACQLGKSKKHTHKPKAENTIMELVHDKKPDLTFLRVFGALCYLINDIEDLRKLQPTTDIGIFVGIGYRQKDEKRSQIGQNRARIWKEPKSQKSKAKSQPREA